MADAIRAFYKRAGDPIGHTTYIENSLEALQKAVGGYIECVTIVKPGKFVILCDEEGRLKEKPYNCTILGRSFVGDILAVGYKGEDFCDVPMNWTEWKRLVEGGNTCT